MRVDHGDAVIDLVTEKHEGTNLQGALDVAEPHVGDRVVFRALLTEQQVDDNGIVQGVGIPAAEVHISDVTRREDFRQISYAGMACRWHFIGEGKLGYVHAMEALCENARAGGAT